MGAVTAKWVNRVSRSFSFNPKITVQGHIYHYIGAWKPAANVGPSLLSLYIFSTD